MALRHSAFYSPLLMTIAGKFLHEEGLEPEYTVATPDRTVPDSLREGSCHVAQSAVATSFEVLERKGTVDIVHFAQINVRDSFFIAAQEKEEGFFRDIDIDALTSTIQAYKNLGCWQPDPVISGLAYSILLDVFLMSGEISQRFPYDNAIVPPPGDILIPRCE